MNRRTNIKKPVNDLDYGIRAFASDKSKGEQARRSTAKQQHDAVGSHPYSVFKRPYGQDNYQAMEYLGDFPPGFFPMGPFLPDVPGMEMPVPDWDVYIPWNLTFFCTSSLCWCEGGEVCKTVSCTYEIVSVSFVEGDGKGWGLTASKSNLYITAPADAHGSQNIDIYMRAKRPWPSPHGTSEFVFGTHCNISIPECKKAECCSGTVTSWDSVNSADTVVRERSAGVFVNGSGTDITWTVSGTGFWLDGGYSVTSLADGGTSVTVYCDDVACGSGTITATACDGTTATGYIRCTTGVWVDKGNICQDGATGGVGTSCFPAELRNTYYSSLSGGGCGWGYSCCNVAVAVLGPCADLGAPPWSDAHAGESCDCGRPYQTRAKFFRTYEWECS